MKAKHSKRKTHNKKRILLVLLLILCLIALGIFIWDITKHNFKDKPQEQENITENIVENVIENVVEKEPVPDEVVSVANMPETIEGYTVVGRIVVEHLDIDEYIIGKATDESLKVAVAKMWGPSINTPGNFSITGHNTKQFFKSLHDIVIGDTFYLIGKDGRKVTYEVFDTYTVSPKDTSDIDQNEDGKREVTLITCNPGGITRFIVKAREKN